MDEVVPTVAGLLLFGRDESVARLLPRAGLSCVRYAGENSQAPEIERAELAGNLHTLYEAALRFVARYCDLWDKRPARGAANESPDTGGDAQKFARANYQRAAFEEAIANALVHRDLALRDRPTRVNIYERSVEIVNARRTAGFAPPAQRAIRYGIPQRLNPQTAAVFSSPAYGLKLPQGGLPALLRNARLFSGRRPEIHAFNDEFRLRLYGI
jgi:predicted HTH transcriptional regulator